MSIKTLRSPWGATLGILIFIAGTGAGAATLHRFSISTATGSGGAQSFLQSSASGSALQGEVASSALTSIKIPFGVLGEYDAAGSTFGVGTLGISTTGYGVAAQSLSAIQPSLIALNDSGGPGAVLIGENGGPAAEIYGENGGTGLEIEDTQGGVGETVRSDSNSALEAFTRAPSLAAVYAENDATSGVGADGRDYGQGGIGVYGLDQAAGGGVGVQGEADYPEQGLPAIQALTRISGTELFNAGVADSDTGYQLSLSTVLSSTSANRSGGVSTSGRASSDLQINGDIYLSGGLYTNCGASVPYLTGNCGRETFGGARSANGNDYDMYASKHASETLEDEGEAVLHNGTAHVSLDPAFASVISVREPYLVFTTPQGDTRGLYVTDRTARGFDVRETSNGHNSLTFDYRIVAHPIGAESTRMALSAPKSRESGTLGRPRPSLALTQHEMLLTRLAEQHAKHKPFHMQKAPASLVSLR